MKLSVLAMTIILAGWLNPVNAQRSMAASSFLAPVGWAATDSPYAAAARDMDTEFRNRTNNQASFSPDTLTSRVGQSLDTRLNQKLDRQLGEKERREDIEVSAN